MEQKEKFEADPVAPSLKKAMFVSSAAVAVYLVSLDRYEIMYGMPAGTAFEKNIFVPLAPFVLSGAAIYKLNQIFSRLYRKWRFNSQFAAVLQADKILRTVSQTLFNVFVLIRLFRFSAAFYFPGVLLWLETVSIWLGMSAVVFFAVWIILRLWPAADIA